MSALAPTLQAFFTDRLINQRQVSAHTVTAYRDTFRLLLVFSQARSGKAPSELDIADLDSETVNAFLAHLRDVRRNSPRTRNARLAAIHSLFRYAALRHPEHAESIQAVLAIQPARFDKADISFLGPDEVDALLAAPDRSRWFGRRDHALLAVAVQTGLRVSELTGLDCGNVQLGAAAHVSCLGKGRKHRSTPLTASMSATIAVWLDERAGAAMRPPLPHQPRTTSQHRRRRSRPHPPRRERCAQLPFLGVQKPLTPCASSLCGRLGYVAGRGVSVDGVAARAGSGHITRGSETAAGALEERDENRLSVHHDQKGRFLWKQQRSRRLQRG